MIINHYIEGQTVTLSAVFTRTNVATDPTTITLKLKKPDKSSVVYTFELGEITRDGEGAYSRGVKLDQPGLWFYRWTGTGTVEAVGEHKLDVIASQVD